MLGLESKWNCFSCGNLIVQQEVLVETPTKIYFTIPKRCGCGAKTGFSLLDFKHLEVGFADNEKEELLKVPNEFQEDLKGFMINKIKEKQNNEVKEK